jgi:hypothetical protein
MSTSNMSADLEGTDVPVWVAVSGEPSDSEDQDVPGIYLVLVDASLSDGEKAGAALDEFHDSIGIEVLDDFAIRVFADDGRRLEQGEDYVERSKQHLARFCGSCGDDELPEAVLEAIEALENEPDDEPPARLM